MKDDVLAFLNQHNRCVLSTGGADGQPEAAMVGYSVNANLELLIGTSNKSRKYQNLQHNPKVAVVMGFGTDATVQYEGTAREVPQEEVESWLEEHLKQLPGAKDYVHKPDQVWLLVSPTWLRYLVHTPTPRLEEMREF